MKIKPCNICGGIRIWGKTKCFKCIIKEEREKRKLKIAKLKERKRVKKEKDHNSFRYLHKKAWILFSISVRQEGMDSNGMVRCYTCKELFRWQDLDAGHYFHGKLDFDKRNVKKQCTRCNRFKHGNHAIFGVYLAIELGVEGMKKLMLDANTKIYTCQDLKQIIQNYQ
jgi:hypothetical protein